MLTNSVQTRCQAPFQTLRRSIIAAGFSSLMLLGVSAASAAFPYEYESLPADFFGDDFWTEHIDLTGGEPEPEIVLEGPTLVVISNLEEGTELRFATEGKIMVYARDLGLAESWWLQDSSGSLLSSGHPLEVAFLTDGGAASLEWGAIQTDCNNPFTHLGDNIVTRTGKFGSEAAAAAAASAAVAPTVQQIAVAARDNLECPVDCPLPSLVSVTSGVYKSSGSYEWIASFLWGSDIYMGEAEYHFAYTLACKKR
ncbi:MAG: hypothetical protein AAGM22_18955 [Acidobacteriota bacterium]